MQKIDSIEMLETIYSGPVGERSLWKEIDHINELYRQFIEASPFLILATYGDKGVDCSPRGDPPGFVRVVAPDCIQIPDRRGNNRLDTLSNITAHPQIGLLFFVPGVNETLRVNGTASSTTDAQLREAMSVERKLPASVMVVDVHEAYLHCAKALMRSKLWDVGTQVERSALPTMNRMLKDQTGGSEADIESQEVMEARYKEILY